MMSFYRILEISLVRTNPKTVGMMPLERGQKYNDDTKNSN